MIQPGRKYEAESGYRYGFNGKENDNEVKGEGNQQDYGMRIYDPRLGRFLSEDPIAKQYPELTPYQFASNSPVASIDLDGLEGLVATGMPDPVSGRPTGMILTVKDASKINKAVTVGAFKAVFSEPLPKKLIDHYAYGNGQPYKLTMDEVMSLNVTKTGIAGRVEADFEKYKEITSNVGHRDKGKVHTIGVSNYTITGGANAAGTLARFKIEIQGEIIYDKDDKTKWTFQGKMRFTDIYDFETTPVTADNWQRSPWGDIQTEVGKKFLDGTGFEVTSDWIDIKQTSSDLYFDWFSDKSDKETLNKVSKEIQKVGNEIGKKKSDKEMGKEKKGG